MKTITMGIFHSCGNKVNQEKIEKIKKKNLVGVSIQKRENSQIESIIFEDESAFGRAISELMEEHDVMIFGTEYKTLMLDRKGGRFKQQ